MRIHAIPQSSDHPFYWVKYRRTLPLQDDLFKEDLEDQHAGQLIAAAPKESSVVALPLAIPPAQAESTMQFSLQMMGYSPELSSAMTAVQMPLLANPDYNAAMVQLMSQPAYMQLMQAQMQNAPGMQWCASLFQNPEFMQMCVGFSSQMIQAMAQPSAAVEYQEQMAQLWQRGYTDMAANQAALKAANGDIQAALRMLSNDANP